MKHQSSYNKKKYNICKNILDNNSCKYYDNCNYAHSIKEQKLSDIRSIIYGSSDLSSTNLHSDGIYLYNEINILTNICSDCVKNKCSGGLNCKNGAYSKQYVICLTDFNTGDCSSTCDKIHLTKRGLIPYNLKTIDSLEESDDDIPPSKYNFDKYIL